MNEFLFVFVLSSKFSEKILIDPCVSQVIPLLSNLWILNNGKEMYLFDVDISRTIFVGVFNESPFKNTWKINLDCKHLALSIVYHKIKCYVEKHSLAEIK